MDHGRSPRQTIFARASETRLTFLSDFEPDSDSELPGVLRRAQVHKEGDDVRGQVYGLRLSGWPLTNRYQRH